MNDNRRFSLVKPTVSTPFHIDFEWWKQHDNNWKVYLHGCLCQQHQEFFVNLDELPLIDIVNSQTGEVTRTDGLQQTLTEHCSQLSDFITEHTTLVDTVFRTLLAGKNVPRTPLELSLITGKSPETILKTLAGPVVYKGIRPCQNC